MKTILHWSWLVAAIMPGLMLSARNEANTAMDTEGPRNNIELPDPFRFEDGTSVVSQKDWARRRSEIGELLLRVQYGHGPSAPGKVTALETMPWRGENDGRTSMRGITLGMGPRQEIAVRVQVFVPRGRERKPSPTILRVGLGCPIVDEVNDRGYALVCFDFRDLAPDGEGQAFDGPAHRAYPKCDWGSLAVWAWGASRVMDYLETCDWVRSDRVVITGHSRAGKAALLGGALDERFAVTVPNGSGCGGASCYRTATPGSETLEMITRPSRFAGWFRKDFRRFADHETMLPFDQHFLRALVAPRAVLSTEALDDRWANPPGAQAGYVAAQPVFDFLGVGRNNGIHFRNGGHDQLAGDFRTLMDFSDCIFAGAKPRGDFTRLPFPTVRPSFSWHAPSQIK